VLGAAETWLLNEHHAVAWEVGVTPVTNDCEYVRAEVLFTAAFNWLVPPKHTDEGLAVTELKTGAGLTVTTTVVLDEQLPFVPVTV
jgi:hypothetical protein